MHFVITELNHWYKLCAHLGLETPDGTIPISKIRSLAVKSDTELPGETTYWIDIRNWH